MGSGTAARRRRAFMHVATAGYASHGGLLALPYLGEISVFKDIEHPMNRLVDIPSENLTDEQKTIFERLTAGRGRILGPYKIWIHSPTVASGMEHIGTYLNKRSSLSPREVEIGILVIAQHWDADYVRQAHIRLGKEVGLTPETIDAILAGTDPKLTDPHERAVHEFATALVSGTKLPDDEFAEIEKRLGRDGIAEVLVLLGYYTSVALGMKVHQVPVPQPAS
jgi:4-carboxymuconolactone decarboxylase